jgi:DNA-directed RNA polymerase subunit N (RpoN/RPB10)
MKLFKEHKTIRNRIRFFSWSGLWAEIKLWWMKRGWKRNGYPPFYDPRVGRTVTRCKCCGKLISVKYGQYPEYTDYFIPTLEVSLKDMRKTTEAEYFPGLETEAALDELMKKEIL